MGGRTGEADARARREMLAVRGAGIWREGCWASMRGLERWVRAKVRELGSHPVWVPDLCLPVTMLSTR